MASASTLRDDSRKSIDLVKFVTLEALGVCVIEDWGSTTRKCSNIWMFNVSIDF